MGVAKEQCDKQARSSEEGALQLGTPATAVLFQHGTSRPSPSPASARGGGGGGGGGGVKEKLTEKKRPGGESLLLSKPSASQGFGIPRAPVHLQCLAGEKTRPTVRDTHTGRSCPCCPDLTA